MKNSKKLLSILFFFLCMYKMVVEITKETWERCGEAL